MRRVSVGVAGLAILAASSVVASRGIPGWDRRLFRRVNGLPGAWAPAVWVPMQAGALAAPLTVGAWLALARGRPVEGARVAAAGAAAWAGAKAIKRAVRRGRPGDHDPGTILRLGSAAHGLGYPSGHAAVVATLTGCLDVPVVPGLAIATAVGGGRIYVGAHYPLDVIGGWALGTVIAAIAGRTRSCVHGGTMVPPCTQERAGEP